MGTLDGKVVIITGGGTGLGKSMCLKLANEGANIVVAARRLGPIEDTAREVRKLGVKSLAISTDVADTNQVNKMVEQALAEMGRIDILINNAGIVRGDSPKSIWDIGDAEWRRGIDVNLSSAFFCSRAVSKYFADRKSGKIINVASGEGFRGQRNLYMYACAKGGVLELTRVLATSLAPYNVRVNCIVPGFVDTFENQPEDIQKSVSEARSKMGGPRKYFIPVGHTGVPDDIGHVALFLASDASDYITGAFFAADGGGLAGGFSTTGYAPVTTLKEALA
jgi:2-dehydro-3-deoxy-D-gluconate 5-dehydrogenase